MVYFEPALKVYVVANITEAVELAYKFKEEGQQKQGSGSWTQNTRG